MQLKVDKEKSKIATDGSFSLNDTNCTFETRFSPNKFPILLFCVWFFFKTPTGVSPKCSMFLFLIFFNSSFSRSATIKNITFKLIRIWRKLWAWIRNCCFHHTLRLVWMDIWWALAVLNSIWTKQARWVWRTLKKTMSGTTLKRMKVAHFTADAFVIYTKYKVMP